MQGVIKWYNKKKGYGFISGEDGEDYFFHFSEVKNNVILDKDVDVEFDPAHTTKGKQAQNIL